MAIKRIPILRAVEYIKKLLSNANIQSAQRRAGKELVRTIQKRIDSGTDAYGKKFVPNSRSTIAHKGKNSPLINTGQMRRAYTHSILADNLIIKNRMPYAYKHQIGDGVPQRVVADAQQDANILFEALQIQFAKTNL